MFKTDVGELDNNWKIQWKKGLEDQDKISTKRLGERKAFELMGNTKDGAR